MYPATDGLLVAAMSDLACPALPWWLLATTSRTYCPLRRVGAVLVAAGGASEIVLVDDGRRKGRPLFMIRDIVGLNDGQPLARMS